MRPIALVALLALVARAEDSLPADPQLVRGRLENGMSYWIRRQPVPEGKASVLLHVGSGSLNETDEQRGDPAVRRLLTLDERAHEQLSELIGLRVESDAQRLV